MSKPSNPPRRQFILGTLALAGLSTLVTPLAMASALSDTNLSRLSLAELEQLGIVPPSFDVELPDGSVMTLERQIRVARRYAERVYIAFENLPELWVYDAQSQTLLDKISLTHSNSGVKDFALSSQGEIFALYSGLHAIVHYSANGSWLQNIAQFGTERAQDLNGPSSITLDSVDNLHVYQGATQQVKVFDSQSAFVRVYAAPTRGDHVALGKLDGKQPVQFVTL